MPNPVIETQELQCTQGSMPAPLKVTSQSHVKLQGKLQATEEDKKGDTNVQSFGFCKITRNRCMPKPIEWKETSVFNIDGKKELTTQSYCMCSTGGKITIKPHGDSEFENISK